MNAIQTITHQMHGYSLPQMDAIMSKISRVEIDRVQYLLDFNLSDFTKTANLLAKKIIATHAAHITPHEVSTKNHYLASRPVVWVACIVHKKIGVHPVAGKYGTAFAVLFTGAYLATNPIHGVPAFIWDGLAYTIHGLGVAPIAEAVFRRIRKEI